AAGTIALWNFNWPWGAVCREPDWWTIVTCGWHDNGDIAGRTICLAFHSLCGSRITFRDTSGADGVPAFCCVIYPVGSWLVYEKIFARSIAFCRRKLISAVAYLHYLDKLWNVCQILWVFLLGAMVFAWDGGNSISVLCRLLPGRICECFWWPL